MFDSSDEIIYDYDSMVCKFDIMFTNSCDFYVN